MVELLLLRLKLFPLVEQLLASCLFELIIVAGVCGQLLVVEMDDLVAHHIKELPRVGDHHHSVIAVDHVVLKPHHSVQIQVICGFVEQEHVGLNKQRARQADSHSPATREMLRLSLDEVICEAEAIQDLKSLVLSHVCFYLFEALVNLLEFDSTVWVGRILELHLPLQKGTPLHVSFQDQI